MDLLPCPFCHCARGEIVELQDQPGDAFVIACSECGATGPQGLDDEKAMEAWNDRKAAQ